MRVEADDVKKVLSSVGIEAESERLDTLIKTLEGKQLHELIAAGSTKLSSIAGKSNLHIHSYYLSFVSLEQNLNSFSSRRRIRCRHHWSRSN